MSDVIARSLAAMAVAGQGMPVQRGYCNGLAPRTVQITGQGALTGLEYCGPAGTLTVGWVLLLRIPDGRPVILGNLT